MNHTNQEVYELERIKYINPKHIMMNGYDETMAAGLALGADGSIDSTFNFMFSHYKSLYNAFHARRLEEVLTLQIKANNIMSALCAVGLIPAIKYVLSAMGVPAGLPRRPFTPLTEDQKRGIDKVLEENLEQ